MTDRLPRSVERTRKAATGAGTFNTNPVNEIANAKKQTCSQKGSLDTPPSNGASIKVSYCWVRPSSGGAVNTNPVNTKQNRTEAGQ